MPDDDEAIEAVFLPALMPDPGLKPKRTTGGVANIPASPEWVEATYFYIWMDHGRPGATKLLRIAEEKWQDYAPQTDFYPINRTTLFHWMKKHDWHEKATKIIADNYPKDTRRHNARLVAMTDTYQDLEESLIRTIAEYPDKSKMPLQMWNAAVTLIREHRIARGLGTYHSALRTAPVIKNTTAGDHNLADMDQLALGRLQRELMVASKTDDERRKR